jgi:hypothetical protein
MKTREERIDAYVQAESKGLLAAFLWALLFGPLGMFYASTIAGVIALAAGIGIGIAAPLALPVVWILVALLAPVVAAAENKKIRARAELMAGGD